MSIAIPLRRPQCAFTLIEVLLALAVFTIGFAMIAVIPAGASLMEKRYEQLTEAEIAAHNTIEMIKARKGFWPGMEFGYAGCRVALDGAYSVKMGTSALPSDSFCTEKISARYTTSCVGGGLLTPLSTYPETLVLGAETKSLDADAQGDFEDMLCNKGNSVRNESSAGDNGWGILGNNIDKESSIFLRVFDTNRSGTGLNVLYARGDAATSMSDLFYFSDPQDRTHFAKGRVHFCHNRLTPGNLYPLELRSYPASVPVASRRVFLQLAYSDKNLNANSRTWVMQVVALSKEGMDAQWPEANDWEMNTAGWHFTMPQPPTRGDLSIYSTPAGPLRMTANIWGLYDSRAAVFINPPSSDPNVGATGDGNHNHRFIHLHPWLSDYCMWRQYGRVAPLAGRSWETIHFPCLMSIPAIIYDWNESLIQAAYPKGYLPDINGQADRRLKVGDSFLTTQGGFKLNVKEVREETRPAYAAADRPYYQILKVDPPLTETPLGGPALSGAFDVGIGNQGHGGNAYPYWRLTQIYYAPPPAGKTTSPWTSSHVISDGSFFTSNPNQ